MREGNSSKLTTEAGITLISKLDKDETKNKITDQIGPYQS